MLLNLYFWKRLFRLKNKRTFFQTKPLAVPGVLREVALVYREVLATYEPDESFQEALGRVLERRASGSSLKRLLFFMKFLENHSRSDDRGKDKFTSARHILEDLTNDHGIKP